MKVYVFLKNGFEEVEMVTIVDYLRRAGVVVETVSFEEKNFVKGAHNIEINTDKMANEITITDDTSIFIPGGMLQMVSLSKDSRAIKYIQEAHQLRPIYNCNMCWTNGTTRGWNLKR